jgi:hypothetical protein
MSKDYPGRVLDDYVELPEFARTEVKRHPRTVRRWTREPDGLPFTTMGQTVLIHLPTARQWLADRMVKPNPRRD